MDKLSTKIFGGLALVCISYLGLKDYMIAFNLAKENNTNKQQNQYIIHTTTHPDFNYQDLFLELNDGRLAIYQDLNNDGLVDLIRTYNPKTKISEFCLRKNVYSTNSDLKIVFDNADLKLKEVMKK